MKTWYFGDNIFMDREIINHISITEAGELLLALESGGRERYQYIYREAAGVYWDQQMKGFKSTRLRDWSCSQWFLHIASVVKSGLGIELNLSPDTIWKDIPQSTINEILNQIKL